MSNVFRNIFYFITKISVACIITGLSGTHTIKAVRSPNVTQPKKYRIQRKKKGERLHPKYIGKSL